VPVLSFTLILSDADDVVDDMTQAKFLKMSDALYEAGCDDGSPGVSCGVVSVSFDREAETLRDAVESAIADVERAGYRVARVEPGERRVFDEINAELAARSSD
jgi:hypothetical protein